MAPRVDTLDKGDLLADFGGSYGVALVLNNPELLLIAYQSQGWTKARYDARGNLVLGPNDGSEMDVNTVQAQIANTNWYKTTTGNQREADADMASDPQSYEQRLAWLEENIRQQAARAGADLEGLAEGEVRKFAERMLRDNYSTLGRGADTQVPERLLNQFLSPLINVSKQTGDFKGEALVTATGLRALAESYGVKFTDEWFARSIQQMRAGTLLQADVEAEIIEASRSRYGGLAGQISPTRSLKDLADPYRQMKASVLEMPESQISLDDPDIQAALQVMDPNTGKVRTKTLWEFEQELRQKPEWGNTSQGRRELGEGAMRMLKDFGFVS